MDRDNTIARLENIAKHAVHTAGEDTFILSLDDGLAIHEAIEALKAQLSQEGTTSDLISRQAAIDALDFEIVHITAYCDGKNEGNPLAQYNKGLEDGKKAIEALPSTQPEPQWVPISDRLPKDGTWNIFTDGKNISVERYKADAIDHFFPNGRWFELEDVIAWMPLPKPFEGGTK